MVNITVERLHNQFLVGPSGTSPADVVRRLGVVQAQEYHPSRWGIGLRVPGSVDADIEAAYADKSIVRIFFMRGTIHTLPGEDVRWIRPLIAARPRRMFISTMKYNKVHLTEADFLKANDALVRALEGGRQLIRAEMKDVLMRVGIETSNLGYLLLMQRAQVEGLMCYGLNRGKQQTFTLLEEWIPPAPVLDREAGLAEFARRFFSGHGPATVHDFTNWAGIPVGDARIGLEAVRREFEEAVIDGKSYFFLPVSHRPAPESPLAYLLPEYDEIFIGYKDRSAFTTPEDAARWAARIDRIFSPLMIDGRLAGLWRRELVGQTIVFYIESYAPLNDAQTEAVHRSARRYADFLGLEPVFA